MLRIVLYRYLGGLNSTPWKQATLDPMGAHSWRMSRDDPAFLGRLDEVLA